MWAHWRIPIDLMTSGAAVSLFQASHAASMISSQVSKTLFENQLARRYCQMFSTGFSSGERDGKKIIVMFFGMFSFSVVCQLARSNSWAFQGGGLFDLAGLFLSQHVVGDR
jgi:hypothetical protein